MASLPAPAGSPPTLENVSRSILAGLGNDSPTSPQLAAVEAWITKEGSFTGGGAYSNNPLNVTLGNVNASKSIGYLPSNFQFSVPDPTQNGGNPVVQFPDLTSGIIANIAGIKQAFATPIRNLLSSPSSGATLQQISDAIANSGWGTGSIIGTSPNPTQTGGSGGGIGVNSGGQTTSANTAGSPCAGKSGIDLIGCQLDQFTQLINQDAGRALAFLVAALFLVVGVAIIVADDIQIKGVSLKQATQKATA